MTVYENKYNYTAATVSAVASNATTTAIYHMLTSIIYSTTQILTKYDEKIPLAA